MHDSLAGMTRSIFSFTVRQHVLSIIDEERPKVRLLPPCFFSKIDHDQYDDEDDSCLQANLQHNQLRFLQR